MNYLLAGMESETRFKLLLSRTRITSENKIAALRAHLVKGVAKNIAYKLYEIDPSEFSDCLASLNNLAEMVELIKAEDYKDRTPVIRVPVPQE